MRKFLLVTTTMTAVAGFTSAANAQLTVTLGGYTEGSSWVSGCWRQSRGVRPSNPYPIADYVFPSRLLVGAMADIVH